MNKYCKQRGTSVRVEILDESGEDVWAIDLTDEMKDSALHKGQPLYSEKEQDALDLFTILIYIVKKFGIKEIL